MSAWIVSPRFDLAVFLGPALVAFALLPFAPEDGALPVPLWFLTVVLVDVAHVWATIYRSYLDPAELRRRPALYAGVPVAAYGLGVVLHSHSALAFWSALAYLAVFHFVRQQYGWVAMYNHKAGDAAPIDRRIDALAIYAATLFPVLWWHANLPRRFDWFMPGDFVRGLDVALATLGWPIYALALFAFLGRQIHRFHTERVVRVGKIVVVLTTFACWGVGIVATNSDYAFTVTNVLIHGVPYFAIVWLYGRRSSSGRLLAWIFGGRRVLAFFGLLFALAYLEELGWDRLVWHEHGAIFPGPALALPTWATTLIVPLLALPQAVHYALDAWIWKQRGNPALASTLGYARG